MSILSVLHMQKISFREEFVANDFFYIFLFSVVSPPIFSLSLAILAFSQTSEWDGESEREGTKFPLSLSLNHRAAISG